MKFLDAIINVALAVLSVPFEIAKMWTEACQNERQVEDDIHPAELSTALLRLTAASFIETTENIDNIEDIDNIGTNENIENIENIEISNHSGSSGYNSNSDDDDIQFHVIKTPAGVKNRVIPFRRGFVKKYAQYYCELEHCG